jgi:hypothetical protein
MPTDPDRLAALKESLTYRQPDVERFIEAAVLGRLHLKEAAWRPTLRLSNAQLQVNPMKT